MFEIPTYIFQQFSFGSQAGPVMVRKNPDLSQLHVLCLFMSPLAIYYDPVHCSVKTASEASEMQRLRRTSLAVHWLSAMCHVNMLLSTVALSFLVGSVGQELWEMIAALTSKAGERSPSHGSNY